jgi:hypothetical protein
VTVRLDRESAVKLFCFCREAERSVHRALTAPWSHFQDYYNQDRLAPIRDLIDRVGGSVRAGGECPDLSSPEGGYGLGPGRMFIRYFFGRWLVRWETSWSFPGREICFILGRLRDLLEMLGSPSKPDHSTLIALRMALCECERIIKGRCYGLWEIELALGIDHFNKTEWLPRISLSDVLNTRTRVLAP